MLLLGNAGIIRRKFDAKWVPNLTAVYLGFTGVHTSGGLVDQWDDLSGNGYHLTMTGGNRPTVTSAAQNGKDAITCNGTSQFLRNTSFAVIGTGDVSLFVAHKITSVTGGSFKGSLYLGSNGSAGADHLVGYDNTGKRWYGGTGNTTPIGGSQGTTFEIRSLVYDHTVGVRGYRNGTLDASDSIKTYNVTTGTLLVGQALAFQACQVLGGVVVNRAVTSTERTLIETWLDSLFAIY